MLKRPARARSPPPRHRQLAAVVAALVFLMVVVGGITRLTESGLSIVRWEPVSGAIPPLTDDPVAGGVRPLQGEPAISARSITA